MFIKGSSIGARPVSGKGIASRSTVGWAGYGSDVGGANSCQFARHGKRAIMSHLELLRVFRRL
jgi:hypothetical protein